MQLSQIQTSRHYAKVAVRVLETGAVQGTETLRQP